MCDNGDGLVVSLRDDGKGRWTGREGRIGGYVLGVGAAFLLMITLICGCSHFDDRTQAWPAIREANDLFKQGDHGASLDKYEQIIQKYPDAGDRVLFEMGVVYSYPGNEQKDYGKSLACFEKLVKEYPESQYRRDSEMMIFRINNMTIKDEMIAAKQADIEALRQEIVTLKNTIEEMKQKAFEARKESVDKILIEKKERRLTLLSKGEALKTYKIALGRNPGGPKEMQGDNKTPEGIYTIDSRNRKSRYFLSLHVSYPNEKDRKRARELGVSPGGDIMIHGVPNGFSWVGGSHSQVDWTKGCIAVTNEEIAEIDKLTPNGTTVEIRP
ncbi:MAG: L,D-transpeptidase family protein [Syntrophobacterales bacterium]|nr:L,D-transpeptidase family protein [Syntrophobacterales bacterium]